MQKDFGKWHSLKTTLDGSSFVVHPKYKPKELWMCHLGVNIGHEQDGQGSQFLRPILIVKIFEPETFWGVPVTTSIHASDTHLKFNLGGQDQFVNLSQIRLLSEKRLERPITMMPDEQFDTFLEAFLNLVPKSKISLSGEVTVVAQPPLQDVS